MILRAPARAAPWMTLSPTPPQPMTATVSPGRIRAELMAAPAPVTTPQPSSAARSNGMSLLTETTFSWTSTCSAKPPTPMNCVSAFAVAAQPRALAGGRWVSCGWRHWYGRPVEASPAMAAAVDRRGHDVVTDPELRHIRTHRGHHAGNLVAEQRGHGESDVGLGHVHIAVAQAAGADIDKDLTADRIGDVDLLDLERLTYAVEHCCFHPFVPLNEWAGITGMDVTQATNINIVGSEVQNLDYRLDP